MAVDKELVDGLRAAKTKRAHFAFVLKGANDGALIVSKLKVPPVLITVAKKKTGGTKIVKGFCQFDAGTYIFETAQDVPPTAAKAVMLIVKRDCELIVKAEFRVSKDPELLADAADSTAPTPETPQASTPESESSEGDGPSSQSNEGAEVMKRLNGMAAGIKAALAGPNQAKVQPLFVAVSAQLKNKEFGPAAKTLDLLAPLVEPPPSGPAPQRDSSTPQRDGATPQGDGAEVMKRINDMAPDIKAALVGPNKAKVHPLFVAVSAQLKNKEFGPAAKTLDALADLLKPSSDADSKTKDGTSSSGSSSGSKISPAFIQQWKQTKVVWQAALDTVNVQFEGLRSALRKFSENEFPWFAELSPDAKAQYVKQLNEVAEKGLSKVFDGQRVKLQTAIANIDGAKDDAARAKFVADAHALVKNVRDYVARDDKVAVVDDNGLGVEMSIRSQIGGALDKMDETLATALAG